MLESPTVDQIDAILPFLEQFEQPDFVAVNHLVDPGTGYPVFRRSESVQEFVQALYDNGWVTPKFDWTDWKEAGIYIDNPENIQSADSITVLKLFTYHVRGDRFCSGHLAKMFESGQFLALLHRLREIRLSMA